MQAKVKTIIAYLEELAPASLALPGDTVGLQVGNPETDLSKVVVALDPDRAAAEYALSIGAEMIVTHHPLFYQGLSAIDESTPAGALVSFLVRNRINLFSAHTNFDVVPEGVSWQLARSLGFIPEDGKILEVTGSDDYLKLVVFVPIGHEDAIRDALAAAGAGKIGRYSHCTFQTPGTGTFMPDDEARPYIGSSGSLEKVDELRLETIMPASLRSEVLRALLEVHPYEEVAYDLYPLLLGGKAYGMGLLFDLVPPLSLEEIVKRCSAGLPGASIRYSPAANKRIERVALCGGSGGSLIGNAARQGAGLLIAGDFRYHDLQAARANGLALVDAGHDATEIPGVAYLHQYLFNRLNRDGYQTEVHFHSGANAGWSRLEE